MVSAMQQSSRLYSYKRELCYQMNYMGRPCIDERH